MLALHFLLSKDLSFLTDLLVKCPEVLKGHGMMHRPLFVSAPEMQFHHRKSGTFYSQKLAFLQPGVSIHPASVVLGTMQRKLNSGGSAKVCLLNGSRKQLNPFKPKAHH